VGVFGRAARALPSPKHAASASRRQLFSSSPRPPPLRGEFRELQAGCRGPDPRHRISLDQNELPDCGKVRASEKSAEALVSGDATRSAPGIFRSLLWNYLSSATRNAVPSKFFIFESMYFDRAGSK
jgi:hypothetical protein